MIVTGLRKKGKKVKVSFDDGGDLVLNYEIFMKNGLKMNGEISENRFLFLKIENLKYDIKQTALNIIARRLHSSKELKTKLLQKYRNSEYIDEVITYLTENRYLDDEKFATEFIEEKSRLKLWGSRKIAAELKKRGITESSINDRLLNGHLADYQDNLKTAGQKKLRNLLARKTPPDKIKTKLISYLISKGFDYDDIKGSLQEILKNSNAEQ